MGLDTALLLLSAGNIAVVRLQSGFRALQGIRSVSSNPGTKAIEVKCTGWRD
ncbi:hypothetical protein HGG75_24260 [Ochrobactrum pseudogrignonense]|nr:hypothetical protein [Brucella pseudogrignonensis]